MSFYALTFTISWASFLIAARVGTGGFSPTEVPTCLTLARSSVVCSR